MHPVLPSFASSTSLSTATQVNSSTQQAKLASGLLSKKASALLPARYLRFAPCFHSVSESPRPPKVLPRQATRMHRHPTASNKDRVQTFRWTPFKRSETMMSTIVMVIAKGISSRRQSTRSHRAVCIDRRARSLDGTTRLPDTSDPGLLSLMNLRARLPTIQFAQLTSNRNAKLAI